jgi:hypothetical protein
MFSILDIFALESMPRQTKEEKIDAANLLNARYEAQCWEADWELTTLKRQRVDDNGERARAPARGGQQPQRLPSLVRATGFRP